MSIAVIIPARFEATRFNGKLLEEFNGHPMLWWTIDCAQKLNFIDRIAVAASDQEIVDYVQDFPGMKVELINGSCGTEKAYQYFLKHNTFDYYISLPSDEPTINPREINRVWPQIKAKLEDREIATLYTKFYCQQDLESNLSCKIIANRHAEALYFSRNIIPGTKNGELLELDTYMKHVGVFIFPHNFFATFGGPSLWWGWDSFSQQCEGLEQNRFLDYGAVVRLFEINHIGFGIDVPEQIKELEERIEPKV